jgi:hypothetical protein
MGREDYIAGCQTPENAFGELKIFRTDSQFPCFGGYSVIMYLERLTPEIKHRYVLSCGYQLLAMTI